MKQVLFILVTLFIACSCSKTQVKNEVVVQNEADSVVISLLNSIYEGEADIFDEGWIDANCTPDMKETLIAEYDYEGEGFGSWIMGGWQAGEDFEQDVTSIRYDDSGYYVTLESTEPEMPIKGHRVIRFTVVYDNGLPKIDKCEWVEDYERED